MNAQIPSGSGVRAYLQRHPIVSAGIETFGVVGVVAMLHALGIPFFKPFTQHGIIEEVEVALLSFPIFAAFNLGYGKGRPPADKSDDRAA